MAGNFVAASSQHVDLTSHIAGLKTPNGWMSFWFKSSTTGALHPVISMGNDTAPVWSVIKVYIGGGASAWADESIWFQYYDQALSGTGPVLQFAVRHGHDFYLDGVWHHFLIKVDGANKIFVDGAEESVSFSHGSASTTDYFFTTTNADDAGIALSAWALGYPTCEIEDVRIYDNTIAPDLSIAKNIYYSRGCDGITNGIKGHWRLTGDGQGENMGTVVDLSGNGYDGTPTNTPTYIDAPFRFLK